MSKRIFACGKRVITASNPSEAYVAFDRMAWPGARPDDIFDLTDSLKRLIEIELGSEALACAVGRPVSVDSLGRRIFTPADRESYHKILREDWPADVPVGDILARVHREAPAYGHKSRKNIGVDAASIGLKRTNIKPVVARPGPKPKRDFDRHIDDAKAIATPPVIRAGPDITVKAGLITEAVQPPPPPPPPPPVAVMPPAGDVKPVRMEAPPLSPLTIKFRPYAEALFHKGKDKYATAKQISRELGTTLTAGEVTQIWRELELIV